MNLKFALFILLAVISGNHSVLPPNVKTCSQNSPRLADCIKDAIVSLRNEITIGGIPNYITLDEKVVPLIINDININRSFFLHLQSLTAVGVQDFKIDKLRINLNNFKLEMLVNIPRIVGTDIYSLKWQLALFNLQGSGNGDFSIENLKAVIKLAGSKYLKNGAEYLKIDYCDVKIKSAKVRVYFHNLFKGNKALERAANEVINQNVDLLTSDIYPSVEQALAKKLVVISNQIFAKEPFNVFFPL